jgi:hypothetical protein
MIAVNLKPAVFFKVDEGVRLLLGPTVRSGKEQLARGLLGQKLRFERRDCQTKDTWKYG